MERANLEPVVIEDLVKFGEDRGRTETWVRLLARWLGRALTGEERATLTLRLEEPGEERLEDVNAKSTARAYETPIDPSRADPRVALSDPRGSSR